MDMSARYLIVGPAWVGDMVMAQSLFMSLKERGPDALIDVIAPQWSVPLLRRMPQVRRAITLPLGHGVFGLGERYKLGRSLRSEHYSHAIVLPRSWKSALVPFFAGASIRTGYRGEMRYGLLNDIRTLNKSVLCQTVQRYVALGLPDRGDRPPTVPPPTLNIDRENQQALIERLGLATEQPVAALMPGAEYGPAKQWPYFAELARRLIGQGYAVWVFGSARERATVEGISAATDGRCHVLAGKTELVDAIDLLARADVAVSNDSGLMHVAAAVGTPLVAIYGSSTPDYTPPLSDRAEVLYLRLGCSPCFERHCPKGHTRCLAEISVEDVLHALNACS